MILEHPANILQPRNAPNINEENHQPQDTFQQVQHHRVLRGTMNELGRSRGDGNKENGSEKRNYLANAGEYFEKALEFLRVIPSSENEQAITYLNMADLAVIELGNEESESVVEDYIKNSYDLLEKSYNDGNQDFKMTAEKCIPVIRHYGYFVYANTLQEHLSN